MATIQSVTLSYSQDEDRIHLATLLHDGRTVRLWLTQRLARRLVDALASHLEKAEGIPLPTVRNEMLAQEQVMAVSAIKPTKPVEIDVSDRPHLIANITLNLSTDRFGLAFACDRDIAPSIVLDRMMVRQWLSMLHRQFVAGSWPLDVWPAWLLASDPAHAPAATKH